MELRNEPCAHQNHHSTHHEREQNADHQHTLLVLGRHREVGEQHQENEDVVDRKRLLDQVAGQELQRFGIGQRACGLVCTGTAEMPPQPAHEGERHTDPDERPDGRLACADTVRALLAHRKKVDQQRKQREAGKQGPHEGRTDGLHDCLSSELQHDA